MPKSCPKAAQTFAQTMTHILIGISVLKSRFNFWQPWAAVDVWAIALADIWADVWADIWADVWADIWADIWADVWADVWADIWADIWAAFGQRGQQTCSTNCVYTV